MRRVEPLGHALRHAAGGSGVFAAVTGTNRHKCEYFGLCQRLRRRLKNLNSLMVGNSEVMRLARLTA